MNIFKADMHTAHIYDVICAVCKYTFIHLFIVHVAQGMCKNSKVCNMFLSRMFLLFQDMWICCHIF